MNKKDFEGLLKSVEQAGEILRGTCKPSREFVYEVNENQLGKSVKGFAVCVETDDPELLVPFKVYEVEFVDTYVCVIDEDGERAVYPAEFFIALSFDPPTESLLRERMKSA